MKRITVILALILLISSAFARSTTVHAKSGSVTIMAAGDIACDPRFPRFHNGQGDEVACQMKATSEQLLSGHPDAVLVLGDNQYEHATLNEYLKSYDLSWGRVKAITYPSLGNHEYGTPAEPTPGAQGYFAYFGSLAGPAPGGYYSYDLGDWHMIVLNSNCAMIGGCEVGSAQEEWLLADLAAHRNLCSLAYWHHPRFTSGTNLNHPELQALWDDLYAHGTDVVLNGHDHGYERFAPQNPQQQLDLKRGIREFVVGTGGRSHSNYLAIQPNSEVRDGKTYGVIRMALSKDSYDWQFLPEKQAGNGKFTDSGSGTCHGTVNEPENAAGPRAVPVVSSLRPGAVIGRFTVDFTSAMAGQGSVLFGPGPGCANLVLTATGDHGAGTTHHWFIVTGNDLPSTVGDVGITPGANYWYEVVTMAGSGKEIDNNKGKCYSVTIPKA